MNDVATESTQFTNVLSCTGRQDIIFLSIEQIILGSAMKYLNIQQAQYIWKRG
jgi:hypothetical protein